MTPYETVKTKLSRALSYADRPENSARLMAVTKNRGEAEILPLLEAGHRLFGENRVQEAAQKWPPLRRRFPDIELHLIGPLQSNKAAEAVALFDVIETLDRPKIVEALAAEEAHQNLRRRYFVQVNIGEEEQKNGVSPGDAPAFLSFARGKLDICGVMGILPLGKEPAPYFAFLRKIGKEANLPECSMGMSGDFETALMFGSTLVRIGSALFEESNHD